MFKKNLHTCVHRAKGQLGNGKSEGGAKSRSRIKVDAIDERSKHRLASDIQIDPKHYSLGAETYTIWITVLKTAIEMRL